MITEQFINDLWSNAPKWVNYIAIDDDGEVWGFNLCPYPSNFRGSGRWLENTNEEPENCSICLTKMGMNFHNWKELIFERPLN